MFLYEFQVKRLLAKEGIPVPRGRLTDEPQEVGRIAAEIEGPVAVKAQVLSGERMQAGGIKFAVTPQEAVQTSEGLLGKTISDQSVQQLLIEEKVSIAREVYAGFAVDPSNRCPVAIFSAVGGTGIEALAKEQPESVIKRTIDIRRGFRSYDAVEILVEAGISGGTLRRMAGVMEKLYRLFRLYYAELIEINPLAITSTGELKAVDARLNVDNNALPLCEEFPRNEPRSTALELKARRYGLTYAELDGDIGILANGAGLAMATLDIVAECGGRPANFIEIGGQAYHKADDALAIVLAHPQVKALFINIYGAFARADVIAEKVANALERLKPNLPIVARVKGSQEEIGRQIFQSRLGLEPFQDMDEAARRVVAVAARAARAE
jgi:succinyl-CoA synthetase beta subunit